MRAGQHAGAPDDYIYDEATDRGGLVAQSGRWWPDSWWDGHWLKRTRCGQWRDAEASPDVCHRRHGHDGEHRFHTPSVDRARTLSVPDSVLYPSGLEGRRRRRQHERTRLAGDYRAYLEARYDDAEQDTRGQLLNAAGRRRGISARQFFSGRRVSTRYASDELRDWLKANGPTLSATEYRRQASGGGVYSHLGVPA